MLAMHMANELLTPAVAGLFGTLSLAVLVLACRQVSRRFDPARVPLMGVLGAFVFAAQMINFPILPGTSGHLGGGVLLAILLGPYAACVVIASILIVQCLVFQDGGLLALGTNIFNMGIIPAFLGYGLFHRLAGRSPGPGRLYLAVFAATVTGMVGGAAMVPFQVWLSGVLTVPLPKFLALMVGLHLLVGLGEAIITFMVIGYLCRVRPQLLGPPGERLAASRQGLAMPGVLLSLAAVALLLGGVVSLWASTWPDALDSLTAGEEERPSPYIQPNEALAVARVSQWQTQTAPLPEYGFRDREVPWATSLSGLLGTILTLGVVWGLARILRPGQPNPPKTAGGS